MQSAPRGQIGHGELHEADPLTSSTRRPQAHHHHLGPATCTRSRQPWALARTTTPRPRRGPRPRAARVSARRAPPRHRSASRSPRAPRRPARSAAHQRTREPQHHEALAEAHHLAEAHDDAHHQLAPRSPVLAAHHPAPPLAPRRARSRSLRTSPRSTTTRHACARRVRPQSVPGPTRRNGNPAQTGFPR